MEKISVVVTALVMVVAMITSGVFNSGFVLAKDDSNSGNSDSGGGSSNNGSGDNNGNGGSGSSSETPEAKPSKPINDPQNPGKDDNKDISDIPEENGAHCVSKDCPKPIGQPQPQCMIPEGCGPGQHPTNPNIPPFVHCPKGFDPENGVCIKHIFTIIKKTVNIHTSSGDSGSSLSKACFNAIKVAWIGKIHRGENHDVDKIIDKCLGV